MNVLYVFIGGGLGACLRYLCQIIIGKSADGSFPVTTFAVNLAGCFVIGLLAANVLKLKWNEQMVLFVFTGLLGGFTTFSTFALEFIQLIKNNKTSLALIYVGLSNFAGLALCALGYHLSK